MAACLERVKESANHGTRRRCSLRGRRLVGGVRAPRAHFVGGAPLRIYGGAVRFVLMLAGGETAGDDAELMAGCAEWTTRMRELGMLIDSLGLHPPDTAATVQVRADEVLLTDGPFAETKEQMGGLVLIDCADRDEALRVAASHPWSRLGMIEVRQLVG
jgi:hypothetical protein